MQRVMELGFLRVALVLALGMLVSTEARAQQVADPNFNATVERPAYTRNHPTVAIDEAHSNFHTATGRYKPFADLLRSDGYQIVPWSKTFEKGGLKGIEVLVISNANAPGGTAGDDSSKPAFTEQECDALQEWVRSGGSLLLIADHTPFGGAAENLAQRFGVDMGRGFVFDLSNSDGNPTTMVYSVDNGLLGAHTLLKGRNSTEEVKRIVSFTGQSLGVPNGATALMKLSTTAYESPSRSELQAALDRGPQGGTGDSKESISAHSKTVGGRAQGIAMTFGKGRLVVMGEAGMFSAQVVRFNEGGQEQELRMGMNVPGNDDRQFALNVLHWLSRLLK